MISIAVFFFFVIIFIIYFTVWVTNPKWKVASTSCYRYLAQVLNLSRAKLHSKTL